MIKTESVTINGTEFVKNYSDSGYMVERDGVRYSEAIDPVESGREYTETTELIEESEPTAEEQLAALETRMEQADVDRAALVYLLTGEETV